MNKLMEFDELSFLPKSTELNGIIRLLCLHGCSGIKKVNYTLAYTDMQLGFISRLLLIKQNLLSFSN